MVLLKVWMPRHKYLFNQGMTSKLLELPEALALVKKIKQCPCCHGQVLVVKILHRDGRVETSVVKREVT